jgi:outer membrane protein OmpA-like peptidoglycan-associated protein/tetratricopeptide (TPR) repeat protein
MTPNWLVSWCKRSFYLAIFLIAWSGIVQAQSYKDYLEKADRYAAKGDHHNAIENYLSAERLNPGNAEANYKLGKAYLISTTKNKALPFLEKVYAVQPEYDLELNYYLGEAYQFNHQFLKAKEHYELFKKKNKRLADVADFKIKECILGDSLYRYPIRVKISNLGHQINSIYDDYSPLITGDGAEFIFTSNRKSSTEQVKRGSSENYEDIYISKLQNNNWSTPEKISPNINIPYHDAAASITPDGRTLILYYEEGAGDLYISYFDGAEWSKPKPLNKNINTTYWETSGCISSDGQKLIFASNRPGGRGDLDLYMTQLNASGEWGKAVNLGPAINTHGHEDAPFLTPDGKTLYFASDGQVGLGEYDIFKSEFVDGKWTSAVNLGYPINTPEYESFFVMSADNKTAYYSTTREDRIGNTDIYQVTFLGEEKHPTVIPHEQHEEKKEIILASNETVVMNEPKKEQPIKETPKEEPKAEEQKKEEPKVEPKKEQPVKKAINKEEDFVDPMVHLQKEIKNVTVLKGKVIDESTTLPLKAIITLFDNETNVVLTRATSNAETGDFEITIPHGGNYGVATELVGYLFNSINFNVPNFSEYMEIDTHILMQKAQVGSKAVLKNIFFDSGKSDLKTQSLGELENIRELLTMHPNLKVQINGHTDNTGKAAFNKALSLKRAQSVVNYLVQHGIIAERVAAVGFGSERPLVSNDDEAQGREINRRTEIEIIEAK